MKLFRTLLMLTALTAATAARADLKVFACEPEWGSLVKELAGDHAHLTTAITAFQDPHHIQAKPSLIAAIRGTDLVVCSGAELEIGWLPLLLRRSGKANVQPGSDGYLATSDYVRRLEVPTVIDKAQGDIHPEGNPHIHLDPRNIERIAKVLSERLARLDPANAADYSAKLEDFETRWKAAEDRWRDQARDLKGLRIVTHHVSWSYLTHWLGMDVVATLEPKPGLPPTGAHLSELVSKLTANPPALIVRTPYQDDKPSQWLSAKLGVPAIILPYTVGGVEGADDLFSMFDVTIKLMNEALKGKSS